MKTCFALIAATATAYAWATPAFPADPIAEKLEKARKDFESRNKAVAEDILKRLVAAEEKATKSGDKTLLDQLEFERKLFQKDGVFPRSLKADDLRARVENVRIAMIAAFRKAISDYTKNRNKAEADKTEKAMLEFDAKIPSADASAESFAVGSVWKGEVKIKRSGGSESTHGLIFTVLERAGSTFKARFEIPGAKGPLHLKEVRGRVERGKISWLAKDVVVIEGKHPGFDVSGTIRGEKIVMVTSGIAEVGEFKGQKVRNDMQLSLQK